MELPTLDGLVKDVGIPLALLDQKCSDEHLKSISLFLDWKILAPLLETSEIEEIELKIETERRLTALQKWKMKYGYNATFKSLVEFLLKVNAEYAEQVCQVLHTGPNITTKLLEQNTEIQELVPKEAHQREERELLLELQKKPEKLHQFSIKQGTFLTISDCMFIASVGKAGTNVVPKLIDEKRAEHALERHGHLPPTPIRLPKGTEVDLVIVSRCMRDHPRKKLVSLNLDIPGSERSKEYYLQEIEKFFKESRKPGATIWYTGHSEQGTGDWCFKDGTISFQDIFKLYIAHFSGRYLGIISDCCYSGKWVYTCAEMLDKMGIPPCGHKAREKGIMIKIFASCQPDQKASDPCYSPEGVEFSDEDQCIYFNSNKHLTAHQASIKGDFNKLVCCKEPGDPCPAESEFKNWKWIDAVNGKMWDYIHPARTIDGGNLYWHYVLLSSGDANLRAQFQAQAPNMLKVAAWGYVLASGSGNDPPQNIKDKIKEWTGVTSCST